ncbi:enhancer of polycomb-like-domain-containing protein [Dendryphion nanum]|uniref:Enhancer of polycomb-like protein n=1 Tax=Dendryphion nanum TaxID=256645 RepID=A0A9P9DNK7_9PLEO|nr:enhancer of polycomb-like-domain-containing protein [Dendryphion nanum]
MTQRTTGNRFRQRKLSTKQNLSILREHEVEKLAEDDPTRHVPRVETGVEKGEEGEHHLQAVISAAQAAVQSGGKIAQLYIPTPDAVASKLQYEDLYPKRFTQPATYIRFSSTVEDAVGCPYCMGSEDAAWLHTYNSGARKSKRELCSELEFEEVMYFFEETSQRKQPYATVDNAPVLSFEELETEYDENISEPARRFAKDIYEHWKNQRLLKGNHALHPQLKFETNLDTDDADPYVCFRRREVRQVRKTRGRDAQVTEKLKKLRKELEEARFLMSQVKRREFMVRDSLATDKQIFDQRSALKEMKRKLSIKGDDEELLINQKPAPKPKPRVDTQNVQRGVPGMGPKPQITRPDGRLVDSDLIYLDDQLAKKHDVIDSFIEENLMKHQKWNIGWIDATWRPITPPLEMPAAKSDFRTVFTSSQLPTPPASVSSEEVAESADADRADKQIELRRSMRIRYATPPDDVPFQDQTRYRRRIGRGGRTMVDRRGLKRQKLDAIDERVADRFKYSGDSSDDEQIFPVDYTDNLHIRYRIMIERQSDKHHQQQQGAVQNRRAVENHNRSASGHLMPPSATAG